MKTEALSPFEITRRDLLKALGGGILVAAAAPDALAAMIVQRTGGQLPQQISAWVHIGADGKITVLTGKVEVGQNARTSLAQAAAEELRAPIESVSVTMGDTDVVPFDLGTFGSRTTPTMVPQVRKAAAAAREALIDLAAAKWNVPRSVLTASNGTVSGQGHSATFGELAQGQPFDKAIDNGIALTPTGDWQVLGHEVPRVGMHEIVTGEHSFVSDLVLPGMLYGKVLRKPSIGANLISADTSTAEAMPGVKVVREADFIAVAAPTLRQAQKALAAIKAQWKESPGQPSNESIFQVLRGKEPARAKPAGDGHGLTSSYTVNYIAHVPLEPRVALARWEGGKMTVWTGSQRPFGVKQELVEALGLPAGNVRVIVPDTGAGYGGKHTGDAAVEAARISRAIGKPVKVAWTRTEEFTFAYFRPAGVVEIASTVGTDGRLASWSHDNYNSGPAAIGCPYDVQAPHTDFHEVESPLRQGAYRSLAACFNNFARETHIDELAVLSAMDPLDFRLKNVKDPRLEAVLQAAADKFGWQQKMKVEGHGYGIACGTEKGSYVATAVEIGLLPQGQGVKVLRAVAAFECGAILNPLLLRQQVVGALIMGIGGALFEAIEFKDGKILTDRLSRYRVPRYDDVPAIEAVLMNRPDLPPAGAGETPIIGIAPAIGNAIYDATGKRLRGLPLKLSP